MKKISRWAKDHKVSARLIIIFSFILLTLLGIITGALLNNVGVSISSGTLFIVIAVYLVAVIAYPSKSLKGKKLTAAVFYTRQKTCDLLLAASTFCMIVFLSNRPEKLFSYTTPLSAAIPVKATFPKDSTVKSYKPIAAFSASLKDETGKSLKWKERKKLLKEQISAIKKDNDMSKGAKLALIILSVAIALGLLYAVAALACNISCGGSEAGAIVVMVGGAAVVTFLLIIAIKSITGKKKKPKKTDINPDDPAKTGS